MAADHVTDPETAPDATSDWPLRPWLLAGLLAVAGLVVHFASDDGGAETVPWRMALTALAFFGPLAAAFALERGRYREPAAFAAVVGLVMAGIAWRASAAGDRYADEQFWIGAGVVAVALALPLFQTGFHRRRFAVTYPEVHAEAWSDALSAAGALAFTGVSWALLAVLNQLFKLVGIELVQTLMNHGWFGWMYSGAAFGAGLGTLRNQRKILGTLQSVAMLVLSILAVPLALGLLVFLVALVLTGGNALWHATDAATPVLLACAIGAFGLGNAILRDGDSEMTGNRVLRIAALVLVLAILPLTVFAAISMGARIAQHGLSPERLWGLVAIAAACAFGLAYLVAAVRGRARGAWRERVRRANLHLAAAICVVALVLALPVLDFGAVSARDQLARLEQGEVTADTFDFAALRWDFGDAGRKALRELAQGKNPRVAELARNALTEKQRYHRPDLPRNRTRADFALRVQPEDGTLRELVLDYLITNPGRCIDNCVALDLGDDESGKRRVALVSQRWWIDLRLPEDAAADGIKAVTLVPPGTLEADAELKPDSTVEVRSLSRRYIVIDGKPVGSPIDELEGAPPPR